jgi:DNA-binding GntR family transcriptional regulator
MLTRHREGQLAMPALFIKTLTSLAFERIRNDILLGVLRPSERLKIHALSEHYGIGATAVREALSRLVTDGLVESEDQKGFSVSGVSREDLIDLTETRIAIQGMALRKSIELGTVEWEVQVLSSYHRLSRTPAPTTIENHLAWAQAHRQFHESLIAQCGSPWLLRLCAMLYDKSERYRNLAERHTRPELRDTVTEHGDLMQAIALDRNVERSLALLADHFRETMELTLRAGFTGNSLAAAHPVREAFGAN